LSPRLSAEPLPVASGIFAGCLAGWLLSWRPVAVTLSAVVVDSSSAPVTVVTDTYALPVAVALGVAVWLLTTWLSVGVDTLVTRRGHLLVGGAGTVGPLGTVGAARLGGGSVDGVLYALFAAVAASVVASLGESQLADEWIDPETVETRATVTTPAAWHVGGGVVVSALGAGGVGFLLGESVGVAALAGAAPYLLFHGRSDPREIVAVERGVVLGRQDGSGGVTLPWWAVESVGHDGTTVTLTHLLPVPWHHRWTAADDRDARAFVDAARRLQRRS
jgi:hypothetical protein